MTLLFYLLLAGSGKYFANATIYDPQINGLRAGMHVLMDEAGKVTRVSEAPIPVHEDTPTFEHYWLLPHFSDFYSLLQERGLGVDKDVDMGNQARMARYLCRIGVRNLRDPIFPPIGLSPLMVESLNVSAGRGYLDMEGGPGESFCQLLDMGNDLSFLLDQVPAQGPVTLWWTSHTSSTDIAWTSHGEAVRTLMAALKQRGQKVGAYIQEAGVAEMAALPDFPFDFYEGIPTGATDVSSWPDVVWVPLAALNDRRYCAVDLAARLEALRDMGLYTEPERAQAAKAVSSIRERIAARCQVWRQRRATTLEPLRQWLKQGGKVALGSAGGHSYCFSGDLGSELIILDELGASQAQLLQASFVTTPLLLGASLDYLVEGEAANFLVYPKGNHWGSLLGTRVKWNFVAGEEITAIRLPKLR